MCWNLITGEPIFGGKIGDVNSGSLVTVEVLNDDEVIVVTRKHVYRSRVEGLWEKKGLVNFPLVELAKCDVNDERQFSFEKDLGLIRRVTYRLCLLNTLFYLKYFGKLRLPI